MKELQINLDKILKKTSFKICSKSIKNDAHCLKSRFVFESKLLNQFGNIKQQLLREIQFS